MLENHFQNNTHESVFIYCMDSVQPAGTISVKTCSGHQFVTESSISKSKLHYYLRAHFFQVHKDIVQLSVHNIMVLLSLSFY